MCARPAESGLAGSCRRKAGAVESPQQHLFEHFILEELQAMINALEGDKVPYPEEHMLSSADRERERERQRERQRERERERGRERERERAPLLSYKR